MPRCSYELNVKPHLDKIKKWAEKGATAKEIAKKLGIGRSTFANYVTAARAGEERFAELLVAFEQARGVADDDVEAALFRRACGFVAHDIRREQRLDRAGNVITLEIRTEREIPPDPTSAMFWLTNRRRERWSYHPEAGAEETESGGVVLLSPVMDSPGPPKEDRETDEG